MKKENKICILLPTYRSIDCVSYFLECTIRPCRKYGIDIYIADSSTDDVIEKYVNTIDNTILVSQKDNEITNSGSNIYYTRWTEPKDIQANTVYEKYSNPDLKVFESMKRIKADYDYIWLTGDNCVLNIEDLIDDIHRYAAEKYDIIHFSNGKEMEFGKEIEYDDAKKLYVNDIWHMTAYGATLINTKLIDYICSPKMLEKYLGSGFLYVMSLFDYCSCHSFRAIHSQRHFHKNNIYRNESGWILSGDALGVFGKNWVEANMQLSSFYDSLKPQAIKSFSKNTGLFGYKRCFKLRARNCISIRKIHNYKGYIKYITDTSIIWMYFLSFIPRNIVNYICEIAELNKKGR